jgi:hypothetical protein
MVIAIIIAVLALKLTTDISERLARSGERLQAQAASRFAFDKITRDLEALAVPPAPRECLQITTETVSDTHFTAHRADRLMFYTTATDRPQFNPQDGQVSPACYQLAFQPLQTGGQPFFGLYRAVADTEEGFNQTLTNSNLEELWKADGAFGDMATARGSLLVEIVVDFRVVLHFRHADGTFESREAPIRLGATWQSSGQPLSVARLVSVEVHLTLLTRQGEEARRNGVLSQEEILKRYGFSASRLIPITAAPLSP